MPIHNLPKWKYSAGFYPFGGATVRFVQAAGWNKAMRYLLTGDSFNAQVALDLNLITEVVEACHAKCCIRASIEPLQNQLHKQHHSPFKPRWLLHNKQYNTAQTMPLHIYKSTSAHYSKPKMSKKVSWQCYNAALLSLKDSKAQKSGTDFSI